MNRLNRIQKQLVGSTTSQRLQDFQAWRSQSTIDKEQMAKVFFGPNYAQFKKFINIFKEYPEKYKHYNLTEDNRQQQRKSSAQLMFFNQEKVGLSYQTLLNDPNLISMAFLGYLTYSQAFAAKNGVHLFLYTKSIYNLGTEKHKKYLEAASNYKDIGCFGLTQLLHGSNAKGILTQAHYDHNTKQFIINTPSNNAMKFWIGAAANIANMSVIWAQLYIDGKPYGVHAYLVPLRDKRTHKLLPGVLIGDCGPKNGHNSIDNAFMIFDNVRIPKENQLDRISGVDQNGKFRTTVQSPDKRFGLQLAPLSAGRFLASCSSSINSLNALTIALRYVCVRRQFSDKPGQKENLLIHYPLTKRRLLPLFAETFVQILGHISMTYEWDRNAKNIFDPKNPIIQDLHGISSIIKPRSTWFANECIKQCRQMLGGHGFSSFSRLGSLYDDNDVNVTWEGDNTVLIQQTAKYALDAGQKMMKGKPINSQLLKFLPNAPQASEIIINQQNIVCPKFAVKFLQFKVKSKIEELGMKLMELRQEKTKTSFTAWNQCQVFLGKALAFAVGDLYYFENIMKTLEQFSNENNKKVVLDIAILWALKTYRYDEYVDEVYHPMIEDKIEIYCNTLSKEALGILDAISQDDIIIGSPFADPDGKGFDKYIKMILNSKNVTKKPDYWKMIVNRGE